MAENYKHLYEQTKKMLKMYQDELIPGFRKQIEELEKQIATDNNVGDKWIPVKERLPEDEGWYQVYTAPDKGYKSINKARFCKGFEWDNFTPHWHGAGGTWGNVTHWMPPPEPPKEVE